MIDRAAIILEGLDLTHARGIEIGPMSKPLVRRSDGPVRYVDQASTEELRGRHADQPHYDIDQLVEIDAVWAHGSLAPILTPLLGGNAGLDYVIASHVIEHVPDLVRWLEALAEVLAPTGEIRLAIPDKRFIFDRPRLESAVSDVLAAWLENATRPPTRAILDEMLNIAAVDWNAAWRNTLDDSSLQRYHTPEAAIATARDALADNSYRDTHCWVFTPASFARIMLQLAELGLLRLGCARLVDTPREHYEFFVSMTPCDHPSEVVRSWQRVQPAAAQVAHNQQVLEMPVADELNQLRETLAAMQSSTSWRVTRPLRAAKHFLASQIETLRHRA